MSLNFHRDVRSLFPPRSESIGPLTHIHVAIPILRLSLLNLNPTLVFLSITDLHEG